MCTTYGIGSTTQNMHVNTAHISRQGGIYRCDCGKIGQKNVVITHIRHSHIMRVYGCGRCIAHFNHMISADDHMERNHPLL